MDRSVKLATPRTALTVRVPRSVAPSGCSPRVTVTAPWKVVSTLPALSIALTRTAGDSGSPAVPLGGGANSSREGGGSEGPPSWNSLSTWQLRSQPSVRKPAMRGARDGLGNGHDIEGTAEGIGQTHHARLQSVVHAGLVDAQVRERCDPVHQVHLRRAPERGVLAAAVVPDGERHLAREAGDDLGGGI